MGFRDAANDVWTIVAALTPVVERKPNGDPFRKIQTEQGNEIRLSGKFELLNLLTIGAKIRISEPRKYPTGLWATLFEVEKPEPGKNRWALPGTPQATPPPPPKPAATPPANNNNGHHSPAVPTSWNVYARMMRLAHTLAWELEPDMPNDGTNDRSKARAALINTAMIAFTNGKVEAPAEDDPEIPGSDAPMPDDEGFPWERAS